MTVLLGSREKWLFASLLLLALAQSLIVMIPAWAVQHAIDGFGGIPKGNRHSPALLAGIFIISAVVAFALEVLKRRLAAEIGLGYAANIRLALFNRQISPNPYSPSNKGTALLPFVGDLTAVRRWVSEGLARGASALIMIPVMLGIIATRNMAMAAALSGVLLLSFTISALLVGPLDRAVREVRKRRGALTSFIAGRIEAASTIQSSGRSKSEERKVNARTQKLSEAERTRAWVTGATRGVAHLTSSLLVMAALLVGVAEARNGNATPGAIAAVISLVGMLSAGVLDLIRAVELRQPAKVALERIDRVLARPMRQRRRAKRTDAAEPGLTLSEFGLTGMFRCISINAGHRSRISIEGPPGAGKSALIAAVAQARADYLGQTLLDGDDLKVMVPRRRAAMLGFASIELPLLPGSLGMNLRYRAPAAKDEELLALARDCGLGPLLDRIGGLDGKLAPARLSAGERQGLALARAIAGRPRLLLLDAIDGQLDPKAFDWLKTQVIAYPGIVLFVAARPEMRSLATTRWLVSEGQLAAEQLPDSSNVIDFERPRG